MYYLYIIYTSIRTYIYVVFCVSPTQLLFPQPNHMNIQCTTIYSVSYNHIYISKRKHRKNMYHIESLFSFDFTFLSFFGSNLLRPPGLASAFPPDRSWRLHCCWFLLQRLADESILPTNEEEQIGKHRGFDPQLNPYFTDIHGISYEI